MHTKQLNELWFHIEIKSPGFDKWL